MYKKAFICLFYLFCALSQSYASSGNNNFIACDESLIFPGKIHSSAQVTFVKSLDENLGLFKINNHSNIDLTIPMTGKQKGYYRYSMFWGYLYMLEQKKGWLKTGVYEEEHEDSSTLSDEQFEYYKEIIIPPKQSIEFITLLWPKRWMRELKENSAVRLYMALWDKERHLNLIISEPYCFDNIK